MSINISMVDDWREVLTGFSNIKQNKWCCVGKRTEQRKDNH